MRRHTREKKQLPSTTALVLGKAAMLAVLITFETGAALSADTVAGYQVTGENHYPSSLSFKHLQDRELIKDLAGTGFDGGTIRFMPNHRASQSTLEDLHQSPSDGSRAVATADNDKHYMRWTVPLLPETEIRKRLWPDIISVLLPLLLITISLGLWFMKRKIASKTRHLVEENREHRQAEQALRRSEERYRRAAEEIRSQNETENILSSLTALLLTETKLDDISDRVLQTAKKLTTSRYGFVGSIEPGDGSLCSHTMTRDIWEECKINDKKTVFKEYTGLWGWSLNHRRPIIVNDYANDPRTVGTPRGHIAIDAFLGVPAIIGEEPAGMIALANPERPYDDADMAVVLRLATIYAMALQRHHWEKALLEAEIEKTADLEKLVRARTAELCESREALRTLADFTYDWEIWLSPDGHLLYTSPSCERITGYAPEDFTQDPSILVDITHPQDRARVSYHLHEEHRLQTVQKIDFRIINRNGELRWISHHCQPVYSKNGEYLGRRGSNRDITERKRNEERLAESETRFRQLFNNLGSGVAIYDSFDDGSTFLLKDLNPTGLTLSGKSKEEVIGRNVLEIFPGIVELGLLDVFKRVWKNGMPEKLLARPYRTRDIELWYDNYVCKLPTGELVAIFEDISHRKQAEDALAESQERLTLALDSVSDAVWDWRLDTGAMYFSSRYYTMLGYEPYEMPPSYETWTELVHEDDLADAEHCISTHLASGESFEIEFRLRTKDDQWKFILARGKTVEWDAEGNPVRMLGTHMDISERRRVEEQMQQVQKMEAIGTLAGGIAHDFNNILGAIIGHGELLQHFKKCEDKEIDEGLTQILRAAYRASDLVRQILFFSRKTKVHTTNLHIVPIVKEVLKMLRASLPSTINIEQDLEIADGTVVADATQMHQVFMNLCTNAGHAMREEGGTLAVRLRVADKEQGGGIDCDSATSSHLLIAEISDTGEGIDREILPQIFEPYFTTKRQGEGTGLGLSIVYGIIKNCGGRLTVDSQPHGGTTFTITLPYIMGPSEQLPVAAADIIEGNGRVLFVDDEVVLVEYAQKLFDQIGYQAVTTTDSREALEIFEAAPDDFDFIITDLTMPGLTGLELCREIRKTNTDIPIVLCSGNFDESEEPMARQAGITAFIAKPFRIKTLAETLEKLRSA